MSKKFIILTVFILSIFLAACGSPAEDTAEELQNKENAEKIVVAYNEGDWDALDSLIGEDFVGHSPLSPDPMNGVEGLKGFFGFMKHVMPDSGHPSYTLIADGDYVVAWMPFEGTFENEMLGLPPNGEKVSTMMTNVWQFEDGKAVGFWISMDTLGYMQQVGAIPAN